MINILLGNLHCAPVRCTYPVLDDGNDYVAVAPLSLTELGLPAPAVAVSAVATSNTSALVTWTPAAIGAAEASAPQFRVRYAGPADNFFYSVRIRSTSASERLSCCHQLRFLLLHIQPVLSEPVQLTCIYNYGYVCISCVFLLCLRCIGEFLNFLLPPHSVPSTLSKLYSTNTHTHSSSTTSTVYCITCVRCAVGASERHERCALGPESRRGLHVLRADVERVRLEPRVRSRNCTALRCVQCSRTRILGVRCSRLNYSHVSVSLARPQSSSEFRLQ